MMCPLEVNAGVTAAAETSVEHSSPLFAVVVAVAAVAGGINWPPTASWWWTMMGSEVCDVVTVEAAAEATVARPVGLKDGGAPARVPITVPAALPPCGFVMVTRVAVRWPRATTRRLIG